MGRMVLVVDDDEGVRAVMATALEDDGWTVETAENGRTALETLNWARPKAIILDLLMPEMSGFEVLTALRNDPETRNIPVIVVSGAELSSQDRDRLSRNVAALRSKGALQPDELLHDLQRVLG